MKTRVKPDWILIAICLILLLIYFSGVSGIPFHPDESTQLAMSADFETLLKQPGLLIWNSSQPAESPQTYRLLDAPLTRYLLGFGRALASLPPPSGFWDWSKDWQANLDQGAYPDIRTLLAGRLAISFLFPFSLLFLYLSARGIGGRIAGYSAIILLGLNALVLLHARRAMAEGPLLFGITAVMASWLDCSAPSVAGRTGHGDCFQRQTIFPCLVPDWASGSELGHRGQPAPRGSHMRQYHPIYTGILCCNLVTEPGCLATTMDGCQGCGPGSRRVALPAGG